MSTDRFIYQCRAHHKVVCDEVPDQCTKRSTATHLPCGADIANVYELPSWTRWQRFWENTFGDCWWVEDMVVLWP
jgi:hypothetical protein